MFFGVFAGISLLLFLSCVRDQGGRSVLAGAEQNPRMVSR
jgi:hypothetical protein